MHPQVSIAELLASGVRPYPEEAVVLVQEICRHRLKGSPGVLKGSLPSVDSLLLDEAGNVSFFGTVFVEEGPAAVAHLAKLLRSLLPEPGSASAMHVPLAVRMTLARALGESDHAPFESVEELCRRLEAFEPENTADALQGLFRRWRIRVPESSRNRLVWSEARAQRSHLHALPRNTEAVGRENVTEPVADPRVQVEATADTIMDSPGVGATRLVRADVPELHAPARERRFTTRLWRIAAALALVAAGALAWKLGSNGMDSPRSPATHTRRTDIALSPDAAAPAQPQAGTPDVFAAHAADGADATNPDVALARPSAGGLPSAARRAPGGSGAARPARPAVVARRAPQSPRRTFVAAVALADEPGNGRVVGNMLEVVKVSHDGGTVRGTQISPDGKWITFDSDRGGVRGVYVSRRDGSGVRRLTPSTVSAWAPSWSPDGSLIAFVRSDPDRPAVANVWVVGRESDRATAVTSFTTGVTSAPTWFPNGSTLAFGHGSRLVLASVGERTRVLYDAKKLGTIRGASVSPDGRYVIFAVGNTGGWLVDMADGSVRRVLDRRADDFTWSPDGRRVAFRNRDTGGWSMWVTSP